MSDTGVQATSTTDGSAAALIRNIISDVCDLDYESPPDDPTLLTMQVWELETILQERLGQAWPDGAAAASSLVEELRGHLYTH